MKTVWVDESGCEYESAEELVWCSVLGFCGCYSHSLVELTFEILKGMYDANKKGAGWYYKFEDRTDAEKDFQELILHVLDSKGLTEHGGSVRESWLTESGVKALKKVFSEP